MEANRVPREADVAPAVDPTEGRGAGWSPADPGPLGLTSFATTTFILSMINSNLVGAGATDVMLGMALAVGGIAQFTAGVWEFRTGNTFGATAFCSYGAFWISFYILLHIGVKGISPSEAGSAVGLYLWAWGIFTAWMFIASLRTTGAVAAVFLLLAITFIVLGIGNSGGSSGTIHLGGYIGLATAIVAWYAAFAGVISATFGRSVLPVFPLSGR
jgi:succinate-acetate transporter protein